MAAAVVVDGGGKVLIAQRAEHRHQGGMWEFPGGKVEPGEPVREALRRELEEEIGIQVRDAHPLIRVRYAYPDRRVLLDVWRVTSFEGEAHGREGQPVRWVAPEDLVEYAFPAANIPIVVAARLPPFYLITPEPGPREQWPSFLNSLEASLRRGVTLVQLRAKCLDAESLRDLAVRALVLCRTYDARLLLNAPPELAETVQADGVHLTAERLRGLSRRPLGRDALVAASCHSTSDLGHAAAIGADFAVLSPVKPTDSHPGEPALGWDVFSQMVESAVVPIYALGGLGRRDLDEARRRGAQGVAAIRGLWGVHA